MRYKSIFRTPGSEDYVIGTYNDRDKAIKACVDYQDGDYCLDSKEDRIKCLEMRNFCICGCGPKELAIEEVE